ncbi:MAG TPA: hypothetical protein VME42_05485 [Steroidobacteraceae bacterium]|nr:hypothetical protein [Steroidobacteraceae bacterium]
MAQAHCRGALLAAAATALLLTTAPAAYGRETMLGSVGLELPKHWKIQMDGTERLTASPSGRPTAPPLVMAEFCAANPQRPCPAAVAPDAAKTGCVNPRLDTRQWPRGVVEKRWVCPPVASPAGAYILAVGHFTTPAWTLRVVYVSAAKGEPPNKFLDDLAKSLRQH